MLSRPNRVRYQGAPGAGERVVGEAGAHHPQRVEVGQGGLDPAGQPPVVGPDRRRRRERRRRGRRPDHATGVGHLDLPRELHHRSRADRRGPGRHGSPAAAAELGTGRPDDGGDAVGLPPQHPVDEPRGDGGARVTLLDQVHRDVVGREGELHPYRHGSRGRGGEQEPLVHPTRRHRPEPVQPHRRVRDGVAEMAQETGEARGARSGAGARDRLRLLAVHRQHRGRQGAHVGVQEALGAGAPQLAVGARGHHGGGAQAQHEVVQRGLEGRPVQGRADVLAHFSVPPAGASRRPHLDRCASGGQAPTT